MVVGRRRGRGGVRSDGVTSSQLDDLSRSGCHAMILLIGLAG